VRDLKPCLKGLAVSLGFSERKPDLYSLDVGEDITAYIDFRGTWKGWRYAFKDGSALDEGELQRIGPLKHFKELRDGIIALVGGSGSVVMPVAHPDEIAEHFRSLEDLKSKLLDDDDYLYLDADGEVVDKTKAGRRRLKKRGWRKLAYALGLDFLIQSSDRKTLSDEKGEYYIWTYRVLVVDPRTGRFVGAEGACSSRDPLLTSDKEVNEADVIHKAQSAAISRGISDLLGVESSEGIC